MTTLAAQAGNWRRQRQRGAATAQRISIAVGARQDYIAPPTGAGTAVIDFGNTPIDEASVDVIDQDFILATSQVRVSMQTDTMLNNTADDHLMAANSLSFTTGIPIAGVGFTIFAVSNFALWTKRFRVHWRWS